MDIRGYLRLPENRPVQRHRAGPRRRIPPSLDSAAVAQGARELTIVNNNAGNGDTGLAALIREKRVRKIVCSFPRQADSWHFDALYRAGGIELELTPQGNLAERIRAAGAGVPAFFTATGVGTKMAVGKEHREIDGRTYILEDALKGDVGLIEAWEADRWGNLTYKLAGRNFNPIVAMASELSIVQTQHVRDLGDIHADSIHTPGMFVDRVLHLPYGDPGGF